MRKLIALVAAGLVLGAAGIALATNSATQTVSYEVKAINELAITGTPAALTVQAAVAGAQPTLVSDVTTSYAITTNETGKKITGSINTNMPANVRLTKNNDGN